MSESFLNGKIELHCGDMLAVLPTLEENSIDSCVCDPPYHLTSIVKRFGAENAAPAKVGKTGAYARASSGFMGKVWDGGDIAFQVETWAQVLRVLKPGAHLIAFSSTRTYHRMACAIEDAGFEIRDQIGFCYGSGFPKSHNISKSIDRCNCSDGVRTDSPTLSERNMRSVRNADVPAAQHNGEEQSEILLAGMPEQDSYGTMLRPQSTKGHAGYAQSSLEGRCNVSKPARKLREREVRAMSAAIEVNGEDRWLRDGTSTGDGDVDWSDTDTKRVCSPQGSQAAEQLADESGIVAMQSEPQERGAWDHCRGCGKPIVPDGIGTALKPAWEPIVLARKPLSEPTIAANVLKWGTGALNIDGCRVGVDGGCTNVTGTGGFDAGSVNALGGHLNSTRSPPVDGLGRWPANLIHDGSEEVLAGFPDTAAGSNNPRNNGAFDSVAKGHDYPHTTFGHEDMGGSAARFFYTAKADSDDRLGSKHPTVKPLDLMQYLVRLVTRPGGRVLDCFAGTGTTAEAAFREGMGAVLIEREAEYQADIGRRMGLVLGGPDERARAAIKHRMNGKPRDDGPLFGGTTEWDEMWSKPFDHPERL